MAAEFINRAYVKSKSPKIIELLEGLGYKRGAAQKPNVEYVFIIPESSEYSVLDKNQLEIFKSLFVGVIDCGENEKLFISIAAIRLDSDIYQWFVDEEGWSNVKQGIWSPPGSLEYSLEDKFSTGKRKYHKASVEELKEKLK